MKRHWTSLQSPQTNLWERYLTFMWLWERYLTFMWLSQSRYRDCVPQTSPDMFTSTSNSSENPTPAFSMSSRSAMNCWNVCSSRTFRRNGCMFGGRDCMNASALNVISCPGLKRKASRYPPTTPTPYTQQH